jgi:hypothetical protein
VLTKFLALGESTVYLAVRPIRVDFSRPVAVSKQFAGQDVVAVEHDGDVYVSWRDLNCRPEEELGVLGGAVLRSRSDVGTDP